MQRYGKHFGKYNRVVFDEIRKVEMADRTIFLLLLGGTPGGIHISSHFGKESLFNMYIDHLRHRYRQQREQ